MHSNRVANAPDRWWVSAGIHNLRGPYSSNKQTRQISYVSNHSDYDNTEIHMEHDIAVICWDTPITFHNEVQVNILLPSLFNIILKRLIGNAIAHPYTRENLRESHCTVSSHMVQKVETKVCMLILIRQTQFSISDC